MVSARLVAEDADAVTSELNSVASALSNGRGCFFGDAQLAETSQLAITAPGTWFVDLPNRQARTLPPNKLTSFLRVLMIRQVAIYGDLLTSTCPRGSRDNLLHST